MSTPSNAAAERIEIRPTIEADIAALTPERLHSRIRGLTALRGGRVLGIGGFVFCPDGTVGAFVSTTEEGRRHPVTLHRCGLMAMQMARRLGYRRIVAIADEAIAPAERWLERLGFKRIETPSGPSYVWEAQ